jgi:hypothetical protein
VWNELKERFACGDYIRISELQVEIYSLKQGNKLVSEFFTSLKILWEELEAYLPAPVCNCPRKCVCITGVSNAKNQHSLIHTIRFLTGLNDSFDMVRSQILLMDPLPPINKVFSMVIQHERQFANAQSITELDDNKALVNASDARRTQGNGRGKGNANSSYGNNRKSNKYCTYCGKDNHIVDNCYRKHGFPPNYGKNTSANHANVEDNDNDDVRSSKGIESYGLTKDQYEKLVNLLQTTSIASNSNAAQVNIAQHHHAGIAYSLNNSTYGSWIIDSGASDHICSSLTLFDSYHDITPVQVRMANGTISYAKVAGTIKLFENFSVHNVLLVPEFSLNLISVPKLTQSSSCTVVFDNVHCFIQEKRTLKMIGSGELIEGLYYLTIKTNTHHTSTTVNTSQASSSHIHSSSVHIPSKALWHFRLGHLSNKRLLSMKHDFPFLSVDCDSVCDICHLARHKKLPYKLSVNKATTCGELIHFDIWGPNSIHSIHGHRYFLFFNCC